MPKIIHTLNLYNGRYDQNLPVLKKLVKPYRKYLRDIQERADHWEIKKLLPFLAKLTVGLTQQDLRILVSHPDFKKLRLSIVPSRFTKTDGEELLMKYKTQLSRSLTKRKKLTALSISIMSQKSQDVKAAILMLEIIDKNLSLESLKQCNISFRSFPNFEDFCEQRASISKVLAKVTYLHSDNPAWYSFLISSGELTNLSDLWLELNLTSKQVSWDSKGLLYFHHLPKLQKLSLFVPCHPLPFEVNFFENLTFPSSLQDLRFNLYGFTLFLVDEDHRFFDRLREAKRVKALTLIIAENADKPAETARFICLSIKCFDKLEILNCTISPRGGIDPLRRRKLKNLSKSLDFQDFWTAVIPSKETLHSISVNANVNEIIFPEEAILETEFPRLHKLYLGENVSSAAGLGRICQRTPNLRDLILKGMEFQHEERLKMFLDEMKEIPRGADFELHFDVQNIKQEFLVNCLKKFLKDVKVKGRCEMYFTGVQVEDKQAFGEILKLVVEKECFESFEMKMGKRTLFFVRKAKILDVIDDLAELI